MMQDTANDSKANFLRLLSYVKEHKLALAFAMLGMVGYGIVDTVFVYSIKPLIDEGLSGENPKVLTYMPVFVFLIVVARGLCNFASSYGMSWVGSHLVMKIQRQIFNHLMAMPVSFFDKNPTGHLLSKITYDANQVNNAATKALINLIREVVTVLGLLALMFYHSWQLSMIFFIVGPVVALAIRVVSKRFRKISRNIQQAMGNVTSASEQMLNGHREVLTFGAQQQEAKRFEAVSNHIRRQQMKMASTSAIANPSIQIIASIGLSVVLYVASFPNILETLTPGTFTIIVTSMMMMMKPLKAITQVNNEIQKALAACSSLFTVLDAQGENDLGDYAPARVAGDIRFDKVNFAYPSKPEVTILDTLSLDIKAGTTVALVGRSGSGKSTIASLLPRLYELDAGSITIDGRDVSEFTLKNLRGQIATVSQHVHLFSGSVAENIAFGKPEASREEIEHVAKMANVDEFVQGFSDGYDTLVGDKGLMLSGGQRQRIAIARALLLDAPILILDEATSALDTESERKIQEAIERVCADRTAIVIAHRLSTIEKADNIVVLDQGKIIEQGRHQALLDAQGAYYQLHNIQFGS